MLYSNCSKQDLINWSNILFACFQNKNIFWLTPYNFSPFLLGISDLLHCHKFQVQNFKKEEGKQLFFYKSWNTASQHSNFWVKAHGTWSTDFKICVLMLERCWKAEETRLFKCSRGMQFLGERRIFVEDFPVPQTERNLI